MQTTKQKKGLVSLAEALRQLQSEEGHQPKSAPEEKRQWTPPVRKDSFAWESVLFGKMSVRVKCFVGGEENLQPMQGLEFVRVEDGVTNIRAKLPQGIHPDQINLWFVAAPAEGVHVLHFQGDMTVASQQTLPGLNVKVKWEGANPHTRERGKDNCDVVFLREDGIFMQLQVSVTTRRGQFWVALQEIHSGQIVRTTKKKAEELNLDYEEVSGTVATVVPARTEDAYPGFDYLGTFQTMGPKLIDYALQNNASERLSDCVVAERKDTHAFLPMDLANKGWQVGHVAYFNLVIGCGNIINEDGEMVFVHFNQVETQDGVSAAFRREFPVLEPMSAVAFRANGLKATAVRVL
ncbi:MAG: hypothetical protein V4438_00440 [Patescibacteria group bacterium]